VIENCIVLLFSLSLKDYNTPFKSVMWIRAMCLLGKLQIEKTVLFLITF